MTISEETIKIPQILHLQILKDLQYAKKTGHVGVFSRVEKYSKEEVENEIKYLKKLGHEVENHYDKKPKHIAVSVKKNKGDNNNDKEK